MATIRHFRAFASPSFNIRLDTILLERGNKRADEAIPIEAGRDLHLTRVVDQRINKLVVNAALYVHACPRIAHLSGIEEDAVCYVLGSRLYVGVLQQQHRRFAAQFERDAFDATHGRVPDRAAHFGGTREGDLVDTRMGSHRRSNIASSPRDDVDDAVWNP